MGGGGLTPSIRPSIRWEGEGQVKKMQVEVRVEMDGGWYEDESVVRYVGGWEGWKGDVV